MADRAEGFKARRARVLKEIGGGLGQKDLSPKGSIDGPIEDLIRDINQCPDGSIYTTSSCSGRITVFTQAIGQRKGGRWDLCSHEKVSFEEVYKAVHVGRGSHSEQGNVDGEKRQTLGRSEAAQDRKIRDRGSLIGSESVSKNGTMTLNDSKEATMSTFRFEPFILCCECRDLDIAYKLLGVANRSGMRESGIMGGPRRVLVGIRCSLRLEVPICSDGKPLVPAEYTRYLIALANLKFDENTKRIAAFRKEFKVTFYSSSATLSSHIKSSTTFLQKSFEGKLDGNGIKVLCLRSDTKYVKDFLKGRGWLPSRLAANEAAPSCPGGEARMSFVLPPQVPAQEMRYLLGSGTIENSKLPRDLAAMSGNLWLEYY